LLMAALLVPLRAASSRWVSPAAVRSSRNRAPKICA
jgi:hypothetical protein